MPGQYSLAEAKPASAGTGPYQLADATPVVESTPAKRDSAGDAISGYMRGVAELYNSIPDAMRHPIDALHSVYAASKDQYDKAVAAAGPAGDNKGDLGGFVQHTLGMFPVFGPLLSDEVDGIGKDDAYTMAHRLGQIMALKTFIPKTAEAVAKIPGAVETVKTIATDPELIREGLKVITPKGKVEQGIKFLDAVKDARAKANGTPVATAPPVDPALEALAKDGGFKDFAEVPPQLQQIYRNYVEAQASAPPAPAARPVVPPVAVAPPKRFTPVRPPLGEPDPAPPEVPASPVAGGPVRPPLAQAPTPAISPVAAPVEAVPPPAPEQTAAAEPPADLESQLEESIRLVNESKASGKPPERNPIVEAVDAEMEATRRMEAEQKTARIIDGHQTRRALKLGKFLQDYAITPEHINSMSEADWKQVGELADVKDPSATTIQKTKDLLKMGQDEPAPEPKPEPKPAPRPVLVKPRAKPSPKQKTIAEIAGNGGRIDFAA